MAKCSVCGAPMENDTCGYCGHVERKAPQSTSYGNEVPQQMVQTQIVQPQVIIANQPMGNGIIPNQSKKSKMVALLLCIFLGEFGIHKFYVGKIGMGILYLLTLGLFGIGWFIDIILIACGAFKDEFGLPLKN